MHRATQKKSYHYKIENNFKNFIYMNTKFNLLFKKRENVKFLLKKSFIYQSSKIELEMNSLSLQAHLNPMEEFFIVYLHSSFEIRFIVAVISVSKSGILWELFT